MRRNGEIDLLRFVFIMIIVIYHSHNFASHEELFFVGGSAAVEFFFLVSGYLMVQSSLKYENLPETQLIKTGSETRRFITKKIKNLCPNYFVAWIFAFIIDDNFVHVSNGVSYTVRSLILSFPEITFQFASGFRGVVSNSVTWYISAMLISMAILFPFLITKRDLFINLIAPLLVVVIFGYMYANFIGGIAGPSNWIGFMTKGLLRAIMSVSLGCCIFFLTQKLKKIQATLFLKVILSGIELAAILFFVGYVWKHDHNLMDYFLIIAMAIIVSIAFSEQTLWTRLLNNNLCRWLGGFSMDLFLSHGFYAHAMRGCIGTMEYEKLLLIYLCLAFGTALIVHFSSKLLKKYSKQIFGAIKKLCVSL